MSKLFFAIVALFQLLCRVTGLSYAELNILVYCALVPLSWLLVVVWRRPGYWPLLMAQLLVLLGLLLRHFHLGPLSQRFYDYNIAVLEKLGQATGLGYVGVSLLMGVLVPGFSVVLLVAVPRRALVGMYLLLMGALLTYFWMGQTVAPFPGGARSAVRLTSLVP
ncbi:hypothetical protein ACFQT0_30385 [Hymenobacter humi]|uniref:Uncharacterized protein n=1 Tax=Hymenobacter humi TaxID=1411620 RepID=A0ABW2UCF0_9BACT